MKSLRKILVLVLCLTLFAVLAPAAWADNSPIQGLRNAIDSGATEYVINEPALLTENLIISDDFQLFVGSKLTVANGSVLTVNGMLSVGNSGVLQIDGELDIHGGFPYHQRGLSIYNDGAVQVNGTLTNSNDSYIWFRDDNSGAPLPSLSFGQESTFVNTGVIGFMGFLRYHENPHSLVLSNYIYGIDMSDYCLLNHTSAPNNVDVMPAGTIEADFESWIGSERTIYLEVHGIENHTLRRDVIVPESATINAPDTVIVVPNGVTLTIEGEMNAKGCSIQQGGSVVGQINTPITELRNAIDSGATEYVINEPALLTENLIISDDFQLFVGSKLTVANGSVLTVNGMLSVGNSGVLQIDGELDIHGGFPYHQRGLSIYNDGAVQVNGTLTNSNDSYIWFRDDNSGAPLPSLSFGQESTFVNTGVIGFMGFLRYHENPHSLVLSNYIYGIDMSDYCLLNHTSAPNNVDVMPAGTIEADFESWIGSERTIYLEVHGIENHTLRRDVIVPESATINAPDTVIVVPNDVTLTIAGEMNAKALALQGGNAVVDGGHLATLSTPADADLVLPADLKTIESEAFAGGGFDSAYIPAGVTSIAANAFGNRSDLTVFGALGSEALTFAQNRGFTFIPIS